MPKNMVIHRDGFSNENDDWYKNYFGAKGIGYSIIEVRKNVSSKLILLQDDKVMNPTMGYCVYNNNNGYLVTTDMKNKKGSPNPILVEKKMWRCFNGTHSYTNSVLVEVACGLNTQNEASYYNRICG